MKPYHLFPHAQCRHFINDPHVGFQLLSIHKGETNKDNDTCFHNIIFILEGELLFSYDLFLINIFKRETSYSFHKLPTDTERLCKILMYSFLFLIHK